MVPIGVGIGVAVLSLVVPSNVSPLRLLVTILLTGAWCGLVAILRRIDLPTTDDDETTTETDLATA